MKLPTGHNEAALPLSEAHEKSRFAVVDPAYDPMKLTPDPDLQPRECAPWLYGDGELESWRLRVLRERKDAARLKVGYPGTFHESSLEASFQIALAPATPPPGTVVMRAVGNVVVRLGERVLYSAAASEAPQQFPFPADATVETQILRIDLSTQGEPPALLIENGPFATGSAAWCWSPDGIHFSPASTYPQTRSGVAPHRVELQELRLKPLGVEDDLFDFGCELLGYVSFRCTGQPALFVGESREEARNSDPGEFEQSVNLRSGEEERYESEHPVAFRYLRITGGNATDVECRARFHPAQYSGAFACSDERLTRIWMTSAYTLRLCMHDFLIDGVKRDRLPWAGDLAMSLMANAYSFGDAEIVRRSLTVLGRAGIGQTDINGIVDYSLWWIIAQDQYQRYFGDAVHLRREWPRIKATMERLLARCDADGLLQVTPDEWLFIDWVKGEKMTSLQILWWWAQRSGAELATRMGDSVTAALWRTIADSLGKTLILRAWDSQKGHWRGLPDNVSGASRHANLLAVVSGLAKPEQSDSILDVLLGQEAKAVGTPYMAGFENIALGRLGATDALIERVNSGWGGMLDRGATTFWEAYDASEKDDAAYSFYGRPFAKSLCHAWSSGPAAFLISEIFGLRPDADGWEYFSVNPMPGPLQWACATVPTPHGQIEISLEGHRMRLRLPAGTTTHWDGRTVSGPGNFEWGT